MPIKYLKAPKYSRGGKQERSPLVLGKKRVLSVRRLRHGTAAILLTLLLCWSLHGFYSTRSVVTVQELHSHESDKSAAPEDGLSVRERLPVQISVNYNSTDSKLGVFFQVKTNWTQLLDGSYDRVNAWVLSNQNGNHSSPLSAGNKLVAANDDALTCTKIQQVARAIWKSSQDNRVVVSECSPNANCGGLADRLLGLSTAAVFSLVTHRSLMIHWGGLVQPSHLFELEVKEGVGPSPYVALNALHLGGQRVDSLLTNNTRWNETFSTSVPSIRLLANRGIAYRLFKVPFYQNLLVNQFLLQPKLTLPCLLDSILRPKSELNAIIERYNSLLAQPSVFPVGVQIRTGDKSMRTLNLSQAFDPEIINQMLAVAKPFFKCAFELARAKKTSENQRAIIFLVTDSPVLRAVVSTHPSLTQHVLTTGLPIGHFDKTERHSTVRTPQKAQSVIDTGKFAVIENWILSQIRYKVISQGGFGKLAALRAEKFGWHVENTTIMLSPKDNTDLARLAKVETPGDCANPDSFVTYERLVSDWSLG